MDRHADPEPVRARRERILSSRSNPAALDAARLSAAKPDAEEAIPVPAGKLFWLFTDANLVMPSNWRTRSRKILPRSRLIPSICLPSKVNLSRIKEGSKLTLVRVQRSRRFIEMEPLAGMCRSGSRSPQYLIKAMLGWAMAMTE